MTGHAKRVGGFSYTRPMASSIMASAGSERRDLLKISPTIGHTSNLMTGAVSGPEKRRKPAMMPERIWLQIGGDPEDEDDEIYMPEVTWSWEKIYDYDPEYIRADIHEAELCRLREALDCALRSFKLTQNPDDYSSTHWSRRAQAVLQEVNHDA